jgi:hypothetical protein
LGYPPQQKYIESIITAELAAVEAPKVEAGEADRKVAGELANFMQAGLLSEQTLTSWATVIAEVLAPARKAAAARIAALEEALQEIKTTQGKVCDNFELCTHVACRSSYASWAIADAALARKEPHEG